MTEPPTAPQVSGDPGKTRSTSPPRALPAELLHRLRTELARVRVIHFEGADPDRAVMLACDLLVAGIEADTVTALAMESAGTLTAHEAERRLEAMADELDILEPSTAESVLLVVADACHGILDGSLPVKEGAHRLLVAGHEDSPLSDQLPAILALVDRLEGDHSGPDAEFHTDAEFRTDLRTLAQALSARL